MTMVQETPRAAKEAVRSKKTRTQHPPLRFIIEPLTHEQYVVMYRNLLAAGARVQAEAAQAAAK
ncbi:hypothetical protein [Deinococcus ruber]|uniref:Uncharacterized protein n=1 Tax=Deinococcus ruber TaxID=1848197 RepID=A0A918CMQ9_9DEIO|nr:hypothetical protein [Deinococcus ruber]GGR31176.1 hypothetical protein GCM10008957_47280 [Deinococcus ruber]